MNTECTDGVKHLLTAVAILFIRHYAYVVTCIIKCTLLQPTVFRGKFCQIPQTSLQNSAAHLGKIVQIP